MFYDRFVALCDRKGVSPSKGAQEAGINKATVTNWKNNPSSKLSGATVEKLIAYFCITRNELYEDQKEITPILSKKDEREISDDDIKFALFGDNAIDDETYESVKNFAKFAVEQKRKRRESEQ